MTNNFYSINYEFVSKTKLGIDKDNQKQLGGAEKISNSITDYTNGLTYNELKALDTDNDGCVSELEYRKGLLFNQNNKTAVQNTVEQLWTNYLSDFNAVMKQDNYAINLSQVDYTKNPITGLKNSEQLGGNNAVNKDINYNDGLTFEELKKLDSNNDGIVTQEEFKNGYYNQHLRENTWNKYLSEYQDLIYEDAAAEIPTYETTSSSGIKTKTTALFQDNLGYSNQKIVELTKGLTCKYGSKRKQNQEKGNIFENVTQFNAMLQQFGANPIDESSFNKLRSNLTKLFHYLPSEKDSNDIAFLGSRELAAILATADSSDVRVTTMTINACDGKFTADNLNKTIQGLINDSNTFTDRYYALYYGISYTFDNVESKINSYTGTEPKSDTPIEVTQQNDKINEVTQRKKNSTNNINAKLEYYKQEVETQISLYQTQADNLISQNNVYLSQISQLQNANEKIGYSFSNYGVTQLKKEYDEILAKDQASLSDIQITIKNYYELNKEVLDNIDQYQDKESIEQDITSLMKSILDEKIEILEAELEDISQDIKNLEAGQEKTEKRKTQALKTKELNNIKSVVDNITKIENLRTEINKNNKEITDLNTIITETKGNYQNKINEISETKFGSNIDNSVDIITENYKLSLAKQGVNVNGESAINKTSTFKNVLNLKTQNLKNLYSLYSNKKTLSDLKSLFTTDFKALFNDIKLLITQTPYSEFAKEIKSLINDSINELQNKIIKNIENENKIALEELNNAKLKLSQAISNGGANYTELQSNLLNAQSKYADFVFGTDTTKGSNENLQEIKNAFKQTQEAIKSIEKEGTIDNFVIYINSLFL